MLFGRGCEYKIKQYGRRMVLWLGGNMLLVIWWGFDADLTRIWFHTYWGPLHTRDWEPVTVTFRALSLVEKVELVQVRFTLRLRDQRSTWMQDGCKVYMGFYMASNGLCFMVTWIVFKNYLLEVGPTQNRDTMALRTLTTTDLFYFILCEDPHEWISRRLGLQIVVSQNYITVVHL